LIQAAFVGAAVAQPPLGPLRTVEHLDLPRYMGTWYEIAKLPNRFQAKCASDTRAEYTAQPDGTVRVVNRCRTDNGETTEAVGVARQVGGPDSPKLQVRFARVAVMVAGVWGDYWIVDLEPDYQLVAVSEPHREYLWILARSPRGPCASGRHGKAPCRAGARCEQVAARVAVGPFGQEQ
jgi:apolipoprotein D and lipocalin family protein